MAASSNMHGVEPLGKDQAERMRLDSLRHCAESLAGTPLQSRTGRRICLPVTIWTVCPRRNAVVERSNQFSYAVEFAPTAISYLVNRPDENVYFLTQLLTAQGESLANFLIQTLEFKTAIRGLYMVNARILQRVDGPPQSATFDISCFRS